MHSSENSSASSWSENGDLAPDELSALPQGAIDDRRSEGDEQGPEGEVSSSSTARADRRVPVEQVSQSLMERRFGECTSRRKGALDRQVQYMYRSIDFPSF
mmetsp:Transcript_39497/g.72879  ORF Transcript_39497/g.72879 Transcript_39497/m.72879 type:complete len:101 (-) Transcript_39497:124-426(-)|eukprot:CAMPEP_0197450446 /NCGR_PEP_ID=MMETSP1175-20131217/25438_2 /TAXON_ID=1003142 /ORGANISM="Triceratium dubium, Strain CCMP147" /LENGTH=100 /DNA_ID=CAMNT_0042982871 /DNA_START=736 /DNA_END=1038 /DNA_ORIENTATION=-